MSELEVALAGKNISDYTRQALSTALSAPVYSDVADMWRKYLEGLGLTGSVGDMFKKFYTLNNVPLWAQNPIYAGLYLTGQFTPASLFTGGEQGGWWSASDLDDTKLAWVSAYGGGSLNADFLAAFPNHAIFQDSAGTTAVTGVEQPVGLIKDKSGRGNNLSQATGSLKPVWSARKNLLLATATLSTQNATTVATPYTISHTGTGTITLSGTSTAGPLVGAGSLTFTPTAGTLTITVSGTVSNAQLEYGTSVTSYQSVVTSTNYNAVGFPKYFLADGVDDKVSGGVNLTATKQASVFYTVQFSDSSGFDGLFIHGTSADGIFAYGNASGIESKVASASTTSSALFNSVVGAGLPKVFTHQYDTTGATGSLCVKLRVSGVAQTDASGSETSGSGFLLNSTFSIFEATGVYLTGAMNEIVLLSRTPTGAEITNTEAFLTSKIG